MTEKEQLCEWIPKLYEEKKETLSVESLRALHYFLGYNWQPDEDGFIESLEEKNIPEQYIRVVLDVIDKNGFVVYRKPYM